MSRFILFKYVVLVSALMYSCAYSKTTACSVVIDDIVLHGTCKGVLKHGRFIGHYPSGLVAWEVHYKDDKLHGAFRHFHANGNPHFVGSYKHGILHGNFVQYGSDDRTLHTQFKKGVLHDWLYVLQGRQKLEALQYYYGMLVAQKYFPQNHLKQ